MTKWMDVRPEHSDPGVALWSWCQVYLRRDRLPERRVVVRFDFWYRGRPERTWLLIERGDAELCAFDAGFGEDVLVTINDPLTFARWHLGHIPWATALRSGAVSVTGPGARSGTSDVEPRPKIGVQLRAARSTARYPASARACLALAAPAGQPSLGAVFLARSSSGPPAA